MPKVNPFESLNKDHRKIAKLFEEIESTTERAEKTRKQLFEELQKALENHTVIEESVLYPALEEVEITHDMTLEAEEEHKVAKTLLDELASEDESTEEWTAKITVLRENIEHHVEEEETELFPDAEKALSEEELLALEEGMNALRAEMK